MPIDVLMPQLSPTMTEGKIVRWLKREGEEVSSGEVLAEVETDKATMELEAADDGVLHKILAPEGSVVPVGAPVAVVREEDEEVPEDYRPAATTEGAEMPREAGSEEAKEVEVPVEKEGAQAGLFQEDGEYDVVIIGAGPGGYVAAIRAAQLGMKVACVESTHLGGICLNWGCIPTKALLRSAEIIQVIREHGKELGIGLSSPKPDLDAAVRRSRKIVEKLNRGIAYLFKKNNIVHIQGTARFAPGPRLVVKGQEGEKEISAKRVIVATGARPRLFPGMEVDNDVVITYKQALKPARMPKRLIVIGSGAIGMEFAYFYRMMGAKVVVLEAASQLLPLEDHEIAEIVQKSFNKQGIETLTGAKVQSARNENGQAVVEYEKDGKVHRLEGDMCLVAVGVVGNTEALGLEHTQVQIEGGAIRVNSLYQTDHPGIYAIGDVIGPPQLAHVASHEGVVCVESIAGLDPHPVDYENVPFCTYCQPQVGSIGKTEKECEEAGIPVRVGRFPYAPNGKALGLGETEGLVKTIFHAETGELLGAHLVGAEATELIVSLGLARTYETTEEELIHHMFPHPTLSEMIHESVLDAFGRAIHL